MATRVSLETLSDGRIAVVKTALAGDRHDRQAEAAWLAQARHRGVVRLLSITDDPPTLRTLHAGGTTLRTENPTPDQAAHLLTDAAVTVADLHDRELVHGQLTLDHLIVGEQRITLCSPTGTASDPAIDLQDLGRCVDTLVNRWQEESVTIPHLGDWNQIIQRLSKGNSNSSANSSNSVTSSYSARRAARELAKLAARSDQSRAAILRSAASKRESDDEPETGTPAGRSGRGLVLASGLAALAMAGLWLVNPQSEAVAGQGPEVLVGADRYRVEGHEGDVALALGPGCPGNRGVVFLNRSTDSVWLFSDPQAEPIAVASVPGATRLRSTGHCGTIMIEGPAGQTELDLDTGESRG